MAEPAGPQPDHVMVGSLGRPHGVDGWIVLYPETDAPRRFRAGAVLMTDRGIDLTVRATRPGPDSLLVSFREISSRTAAEDWRGASLYVSSSERRLLAEDEFWPESLIGLEVRGVDGSALGVISEVELGPSQDRIVVMNGESTVLVPLVRALVTEIHATAGYLVLDPIPGLFPQSEESSSGISTPSKLPSAGE